MIIPTAIGMILLYTPFAWCRYRNEDQLAYGLSWRFDKKGLIEGLIITFAVLGFLTLVAMRWPLEHLPRHRTLWSALNLACAGLAAAIIEEVFYRGWIQPLLRKKLRASWAILITGAIFAASHVFVARMPFLIAVFFPGCIMGFLRERHGNISTSTMFHFLGNLWAIWFAPLTWPAADQIGSFLEAML